MGTLEDLKNYKIEEEPKKKRSNTFRIKSSGNVKKIAGAIIGELEYKNYIELACMGAGSINQGVKSLIIARSALTKKAINTEINMGFRDTNEIYNDGKPKSIIVFTLRKQ